MKIVEKIVNFRNKKDSNRVFKKRRREFDSERCRKTAVHTAIANFIVATEINSMWNITCSLYAQFANCLCYFFVC